MTRRRTVPRLLLAAAAALCLPAWLAPEWSLLGGTPATARRHMMADLGPEAYPELPLPAWLARAAEGGAAAAAVDAAAGPPDAAPAAPPLPPYGLLDVVRASHSHFLDTVAILLYDPPSDAFVMLHAPGRHPRASAFTKLGTVFTRFTYMLRQAFPERFLGAESEELAIGITAGDYPHLRKACLPDLPHPNPRCPPSDVPFLGFGSVFRHAEILTNLLAMPLSATHLQCFKAWAQSPKAVCKSFRPAMPGTYSETSARRQGELVFGEEFDLKWEDLVPQVVWRGTDFGYLTHLTSLREPKVLRDIAPHLPPSDGAPLEGADKRAAGTRALRAAYDQLLPRWKGVVLTAEAERAAEAREGGTRPWADVVAERAAEGATGGTLPWADVKFTKGRRGTEAEAREYAQFAEYGIAAIGGRMALSDLARHKYQLDLGGGGGTTWSGTLHKLAMPGLLFHHVTPTKDYIHDRMRPWVHYVPVAADLSDLKDKFDWAEAHPAAAKRMAEEGSALLRRLGTAEGFGELYEEAFLGPVRRVLEAYRPVSATRPGSGWREVLKEWEGDGYVQEWSCTGTSFDLSEGCKQFATAI